MSTNYSHIVNKNIIEIDNINLQKYHHEKAYVNLYSVNNNKKCFSKKQSREQRIFFSFCFWYCLLNKTCIK